ncbi:MAG: oxidoreductase family protein [Acidobacteriales bacterium]|nr:oxidoreductase family protein [Terriglobales bacterium]
MAAQRPIYTAKLTRTEVLSDRADCKHLEFEVQELASFDFAAGQFVSMLAKNNEKQMTRAYSLASGPRGNNQFELCLNRVEGGFFSNYLCDMEHGNTVHFHGPHGHFVLRNPLRDSLMIATGTGIAPMRGFVEWLFPLDGAPDRSEAREIWLVFGTRHESEIYYREYFEEVARKYPNFHYLITLSRGEQPWQGLRGYVQEHVKKILEGRPDRGKNDMDAYICGLNNMVSANRALLAECGWERKQIIFERYD